MAVPLPHFLPRVSALLAFLGIRSPCVFGSPLPLRHWVPAPLGTSLPSLPSLFQILPAPTARVLLRGGLPASTATGFSDLLSLTSSLVPSSSLRGGLQAPTAIWVPAPTATGLLGVLPLPSSLSWHVFPRGGLPAPTAKGYSKLQECSVVRPFRNVCLGILVAWVSPLHPPASFSSVRSLLLFSCPRRFA